MIGFDKKVVRYPVQPEREDCTATGGTRGFDAVNVSFVLGCGKKVAADAAAKRERTTN
jgi:hypothetical protein